MSRKQITGQVSLYDALVKPGDYVDAPGRELTFDEVTQRVGRLIVMDQSTESHAWYKVVLVEEIIDTDEGRRLIYFYGNKQRGLVNERYFALSGHKSRFPARAYELPENIGRS